MTRALIGVALALALCACDKPSGEIRTASRSPTLERGRYLTVIGGCNDCHTAGYALQNGQVDQKDWLQGDTVGWQGPWGTTYAANLRVFFQKVTEAEWVEFARTSKMRPPMPWFNLRRMEDDDLRALYQFIHSLGAAGDPAPGYLAPDRLAPAPKFVFVLPAAPASASPAPGG